MDTAAAFAESGAVANRNAFPDQTEIDVLIDGLAPADLQAMLAGLLQPIFERLQTSADETELLGQLAECFPHLDGTALVEQLTRLLFVAELWGSASAGEEARAEG